MRPHIKFLIVMTFAAAALSSGCGVGYNGSVILKDEDRRRAAAYQQFLQQRDAKLEQHQQATTPVPFDAKGGMRPSTAVTAMDGRPENSAAVMARTSTGEPALRTPVTGYRPMDIFGASASGSRSSTDGAASHLNTFQVTFTTEGGDFDPSVSPDGAYLVYASTRHRETADIYLKRVDGTAVTQLTADPANDVMPTFSPDGKWVAFASDRSGNWDLYLLDREGGQPIQLTNDPAAEVHPSFSRDGSQIIYSTRGSQTGRWEMVVIDVQNPTVKRFIGYGLFPEWSPVSDRILFQRARDRGTRWFSVWTVDLIDGEATRPTEIIAAANAASITPHWSPDGKHVVFSTVVEPDKGGQNHPRQADIWIMDIDGRTRINLTNNQFANTQPVWSSDGTVYYASNRHEGGNGGENIWAIRADRALMTANRAGSPGMRGNAMESHAAGTPVPDMKKSSPAMNKPSMKADGSMGMSNKMVPAAAPTTQPATDQAMQDSMTSPGDDTTDSQGRLDDSAVFVPVK